MWKWKKGRVGQNAENRRQFDDILQKYIFFWYLIPKLCKKTVQGKYHR